MLRLKASYMVKPAKQTPNEVMKVSECDQVKAITHAPTVYFYRPATKSLKDPINTLKDSLSKAMVLFYPLAGRLHWSQGGRVELHCNSMGSQFLEAESDAKVDDFGNFCPSPQILALIPSVDYNNTPLHEIPLFLVQFTKFSCGGISLGMGLSHVIADGPSALHFISEWAKIARGWQSTINNDHPPPFLDRTILNTIGEDPALLSKPRFDNFEYSPPLLIGADNNMEERKKPTTVAMLKLSKEEIEKLKNKANKEDQIASHRYSRYEAVAGHMWRCMSKARGHASEQSTRLHIAMDFRNRLVPPLPPLYFGNAIIRLAAETTAGDLLSKPLGYASSKIRETVENASDEYLKSYLVFLKNLPDVSGYRNFHTVGCTQGIFNGNPNLEITSWVTLPLYGVDFGWGEEIYMGPGAVGYDGKAFILPGRDEDGSFVIVLRLQVAHMDAFNKYFYQDIY